MHIISQILILLVALLHFYFLWMEMFAWTTVGRRTFRSLPSDLFEPTKALAANQGLYNGFLAAGLVWSLLINEQSWQQHIASFFLICIIIAGIYGAISASRKIFFVQALPALIALLSLYLLKA
jgi:putative membrane protein